MYDIRRPKFCRGKPCLLLKTLKKSIPNIKKDFSGSAPGVFVGRFDYPNVNVGLLATSYDKTKSWMMTDPEYWYSSHISVDSFLKLRYNLINSRNKIHVKKSNRFLENIQEIALSSRPVDTELNFKKDPYVKISLSNISAPIGITGDVEKIRITENPRILSKVDKIVNDDLKAVDSSYMLYNIIPVHNIQEIFSVGLLGKQKKIVPTRYSITAVDDILSKKLISEIKNYATIDEIRVFRHEYLGNTFFVIMFPRYWEFEMFEKWDNYSWISDYESYDGRTRYASNVTGGYYAARLAVCEYLSKIRRQSAVLILRTVLNYSSIGVWLIRETVRNLLHNNFLAIDSMSELNKYIPNIKSKIIGNYKNQRLLSDFAN